MVGVLDYGMGNLRSVTNAIKNIGFDPVLIPDSSTPPKASHLILPGVGSYSRAIQNLQKSGLTDVIREHVYSGKPFLGICLGMQLLSSKGFEHGETDGLGIIEGKVVPFELRDEFLVPHMGWNSLELQRTHPVFEGIKSYIDYYFVHSFYFQTIANEDVLAVTSYESNFTSVVARKNVVGVQFHPESILTPVGKPLLQNFLNRIGE